MNNVFRLIVIALLFLLLLGSCAVFFNDASKCEGKGGEYMRKLDGTYACVKELK